MKRANTSGRTLSASALAMMTRLVCLSKSGASDDFMINRVLPASSSATPNGAPAPPTSTCPGMVAGLVGAAMPGGGGFELLLWVVLRRETPGQGGRAVVGRGAC